MHTLESSSKQILRLEDLSRYGKPATEFPKETLIKQISVVFSEVQKKFGLFGLFPFAVNILLEQRRLKKEYPKSYQDLLNISPLTAKEFIILVAIFNIIAKKEDSEKAYEFIKGISRKIAIYTMPAIYQIDDLVKCDGDVFDNFKTFTIVLFKASCHIIGTKIGKIIDEKDKLTIIITKCRNVTLAKAFNCPEIAKSGCDHDLVGYGIILDRVNAEFRRPCTIAKGDDCCKFMFYRKGTAPDTEYLNK